MALTVENLHYDYGRGKSAVSALRGVSLSVNAGSIYGLLGPSGCGKTTLISCLLGIKKPKSGSIRVLGHSPHHPDNGVPGFNVGYMPQSIALHSFFSAKEILQYYATIFGVQQGEEKAEKLLKRLQLFNGKTENLRISLLSGGQMRRVSLICALIHSPKLLILDEPTVGVDPMLREEVWNILLEYIDQGHTVLITTHYMEEASKANRIGFLRKGQLLYDGCPDKLKAAYGHSNLDDTFLNLCQQHQPHDDVTKTLVMNPDNTSNFAESDILNENAPLLKDDPHQPVEHVGTSSSSSWQSFKALVAKNLVVLKRHHLFMAFQALLPMVTCLIFYASIGKPLHGLRLAFVNNDKQCDFDSLTNVTCLSPVEGLSQIEKLIGSDISCHIIQELDKNVFGYITAYPTIGEAEESVILNQNNGLLVFHEGFSKSLIKRLKAMITTRPVQPETLELSQISVSLDQTNLEISRSIKISLIRSVHNYFVHIAEICKADNLARSLSSLGIAIKALNGMTTSRDLSRSILSSMVPVLICMMAMALTADVIYREKEDGVLIRDAACGVSIVTVLIAQLVTMLIIVILQIICMLGLLLIVFHPLSAEIFFYLMILLLFQGICGMCLGFFLMSVCNTREQILQVGIALVFPSFILSGMLWPRIAMPKVFQYLGIVLPFTITSDVTRYVILNKTLKAPNTELAFFLPLIWASSLFIVTLFILRWSGMK